jgi:LuxR family transcriptional regulator, maltose regulon positive regulatory protein
LAASISCLEAAAVLLRSAPFPLELADALLWLAQARQLAGSPDSARAALGEARLVLEQLPELGILAERWEATERLLSGDQPDVAPAALVSVDELSARERDVLRMLPTALSEAEIGQELFISYHTVHSHVRTIYRKLGTTSRAQTVERARATGLLPTPLGRSTDGAGG